MSPNKLHRFPPALAVEEHGGEKELHSPQLVAYKLAGNHNVAKLLFFGVGD